MKLGRKPALHTLKTMRRALALAPHLDALGTPPTASNDYLSAVHKALGGNNWQFLGNNLYGDCTFADSGHTLMLRTANAGPTIVTPTEQDVLAAYSALTGFNPNDPNTDNGATETDVCAFMETTGLLGHKSVGTSMIDPTNLDHVRWCVQLFGSCRIGVNLPDSAQDQFNNGQPWTVVDGSQIDGGHDVPIVGYQGDTFTIITWGTEVQMTLPFFQKYVDEAHCEVFGDWIQASGVAPSGLDLNALVADVSAVQ